MDEVFLFIVARDQYVIEVYYDVCMYLCFFSPNAACIARVNDAPAVFKANGSLSKTGLVVE